MTCQCGCGQPTTRVKQREGQYQAGDYRKFVRGHYRRLMPTDGYPEAAKQLGGRRIQVHRLRAEKALGKPLPAGAVVHHADGSKRPDAPLVICQDETYHRLLHIRMRVKAHGGNPDTDAVCCYCQYAKPKASFSPDTRRLSGVYGACRWCRSLRTGVINA